MFLSVETNDGNHFYSSPIFPADDPTTVVGFIGTSLNWEEVLTNIVPDFVDGVHCVISDGKGTAHTYVINNGQPELLGEDVPNCHEQESQSIVLTEQMETGAAMSTEYTLTLYPTQAMYDSYSTHIPLSVALIFVATIGLCTCVFFLYDHMMKREAHQRTMVLEMKRKFVRFVR